MKLGHFINKYAYHFKYVFCIYIVIHRVNLFLHLLMDNWKFVFLVTNLLPPKSKFNNFPQ